MSFKQKAKRTGEIAVYAIGIPLIAGLMFANEKTNMVVEYFGLKAFEAVHPIITATAPTVLAAYDALPIEQKIPLITIGRCYKNWITDNTVEKLEDKCFAIFNDTLTIGNNSVATKTYFIEDSDPTLFEKSTSKLGTSSPLSNVNELYAKPLLEYAQLENQSMNQKTDVTRIHELGHAYHNKFISSWKAEDSEVFARLTSYSFSSMSMDDILKDLSFMPETFKYGNAKERIWNGFKANSPDLRYKTLNEISWQILSEEFNIPSEARRQCNLSNPEIRKPEIFLKYFEVSK